MDRQDSLRFFFTTTRECCMSQTAIFLCDCFIYFLFNSYPLTPPSFSSLGNLQCFLVNLLLFAVVFPGIGMSSKASFKRYTQCSRMVTLGNKHVFCLLCLPEGQNVPACPICWEFIPKEGQTELCFLKQPLGENTLLLFAGEVCHDPSPAGDNSATGLIIQLRTEAHASLLSSSLSHFGSCGPPKEISLCCLQAREGVIQGTIVDSVCQVQACL